MKDLSKSLRSKRFSIKKNSDIKLVIQLNTGELMTLKVLDCSTQGLGCEVGDITNISLINELDIIASSKMMYGEIEYPLGRLVIKRKTQSKENEKNWFIGISAIDTQIPTTSFLSKHIDQNFDGSNWSKGYELSPNKFSLADFVENGSIGSNDLFEKLDNFHVFFKEWSSSDKYGYYTIREKSKGKNINLLRKRQKNQRNDYLSFGSNDYLGLSANSEVENAIIQAVKDYGFGSTGSPVTTGITNLHEELCNKIAKMFKKEKCILFNSGYAANIGLLSGLCFENDLIVSDILCHASIQDGMKMSNANKRLFRHNDADFLDKILTRERDKFNGGLVVTEGVFSMDGDVSKLDKIYEVARKHDCRILVDQAHCFGVLGENGLGVVDKYNLMRETDIIMGTFSKICGGIGGFVCGPEKLIDWIHCFSRSYLFSVSLPPPTVAGVLKSLEIFERDRNELLGKLRRNIKHFCTNLSNLGYKLPVDHESTIIPIVIGDEEKMGIMYQSLLEDGIFVVPIIYPAVSRNNCRFRFTMNARFESSDIDYVTMSLEKAMLKANFKFNE